MSSQSSDFPFPSNELLESNIRKSSNWMKWRDVPINKWYRIVHKESLDTKYGESMILTLEDKNANKLITFTTPIIKKAIENCPDCNFIISTGKVENKKYYGFEISTIPILSP